MRLVMAEAVYKIVAHNGGWGVLHGGTVSGDYITKEAAFEAVVGLASNAIKNGQAVTITVEGRERAVSQHWESDEAAVRVSLAFFRNPSVPSTFYLRTRSPSPRMSPPGSVLPLASAHSPHGAEVFCFS